MPKVAFGLFVLYIIFLMVISSKEGKNNNFKPQIKADIDSLKKRGTLNILVEHNSFNYYIYKGSPMGFQYELACDFAQFLGLRPNIVLSDDLNKSFAAVSFEDCDVLTSDITIAPSRYPGMCLSQSLYSYRAVVAVHSDEVEKSIIYEPTAEDIISWERYFFAVPDGSCFPDMLKRLSDSTKQEYNYLRFRNVEPEEMLSMTSSGAIKASICDEQVALANLGILPNVRFVYLPFPPRPLAWGVSCKAPKLLGKLNEFLNQIDTKRKIEFFKIKYFSPYSSYYHEISGFHSKKGSSISQYDRTIKKISKKYHLDWRLVASVIFQESNFQEGYVSYNGAMGLMQLMPGTAARYGMHAASTAEQQIDAGVHLLADINASFLSIAPDSSERMKFTLAAYNLGDAHILDAVALAKKNSQDPSRWSVIEFWLQQKTKSKFYRDPVVKYGYCNPKYVKIFVRQVIDRYQQYCNLYPL